jgi:hypothetical protein
MAAARFRDREPSPYRLYYSGETIELSAETAEQLHELLTGDVRNGATVVAEFKQAGPDGAVMQNSIVLGPGIAARLVRPA